MNDDLESDSAPHADKTADALRRTPLFSLHNELGARMAPFAGWAMPVSYDGVLAEHAWCRNEAGLFDVSHMAVVELRGDDPARSLESVTAAGITTLDQGRQRYGLLLNDDGGVVDDFIVTNWGAHLTVVSNASRRDVDLAYLTDRLSDVDVVEMPDVALIAVQGPKAAEAVVDLATGGTAADIQSSVFLDNVMAELAGIQVAVGRSGYTGEDGFEIAVSTDNADRLARALLDHPAVKPIGLGARDTLRLEAGLCLYGNDLDETTSPVEADLLWTVPKRRREQADFPGATRILAEIESGPSRIRVGLQPVGKRPIRPPAELQSSDGLSAGLVCSGGFGPTIDGPVSMAYINPDHASPGSRLAANVRGKPADMTVVTLPFTPHRYLRR